MTLEKALSLLAFIVFSVFVINGIRWMLNQRSDLLLVSASVVIVLYIWVSFKSKAFTKNPFKK